VGNSVGAIGSRLEISVVASAPLNSPVRFQGMIVLSDHKVDVRRSNTLGKPLWTG
jgi:hypothetical protein